MKTLQELEDLSDEELRVMLAATQGWRRFAWVTELRYGIEKDYCDINRLPNYPADLNACHEVEVKLTVDQSPIYVTILWPQGYGPMHAIAATPRRRTIALILTLQQS